jgi:hypothetical protein
MSDSELVPEPYTNTKEFAHLEAELDRLSRKLAEKELDLATLENDLSIFEKKYAEKVGLHLVELDFLDTEIARELFRLNPKEEYKQGFESAERKAKRSKEAVNEKLKSEKKKKFEPSEDLKKLFRRVAKQIHPDLATDDEERGFRTDLMAKANEAYKNGDDESLRNILVEWEQWKEKPRLKEDKVEELSELELLKQKVSQIKARIKIINAHIKALKESELYKLMIKVEEAEKRGADLLGEMAKDLQMRIQAAREMLKSLRQQEA